MGTVCDKEPNPVIKQPSSNVPQRENRESRFHYIDPTIANTCKSLCRIAYKNEDSLISSTNSTISKQFASGFLIKLFKKQQEFFCLMTNEHVVTKEMIIKNKTIIFYYDNCDLKINK